MAYLMIRHRVKDYATWKPVFDEHAKARKAAGSKGGHLLRSADDPNNLVILLEWDSVANARRFVESHNLNTTMEHAGVVDKPNFYFLEEIEKPSA